MQRFQQVAREWAVKHAGAPKDAKWTSNLPAVNLEKKKPTSREEELRRYQGYNKDLIDRFVNMGFDLDRVVEAFNYVNIDRNNGEDYELEEAYMGDITARLLGEP
ncbi:hypothetical protein DH86_00000921 [Scytalidium sp. 3C]|nr:hypothetical protein DH86_00000921 [Scytalidium sp. 3C]